MKLEPVTKLDIKKIDDDVISTNFDVIVVFPILCQFGAMWKPVSGRIVCKTYFH